ncbi:MAG: hypothetical protein R6X18_19965 [Chloroflexota bacterium]|jgi:hypothetical protein
MTLNQLLIKSPARWLEEHGKRWWRPALVLSVLAISVLAPYMLPGNRIPLLIGVLPALAIFILILRWPSLGLAALIVTSLIVRSPNLPGGLNLAVLLLAFLVGLWVLGMIVYKRVWLFPSRSIRPLLALVLVACISFGIGQLGWFSYAQPAPIDAQIGGLLIFILSVGAFLIAAHQITSLRWLQWLTFLFIGLGALFILGWLVSPVGRITGQIFQIGATSNSMFWTWLVALAFSQAVFNQKLPIPWRIVLIGIVLLTIYVAYFNNSGWKSGYLPALAAIAAMVGARSWRAGLFIGLVSILPAMYLSSEAIATDEYSYSTRLDAWIIMWEVIKVNPLLGFGPANYYWYTPLFRIRGYAVQFSSHNQYIDIAAQTGILGLICFLWWGVEMALIALRLRKTAAEGFAQAYVYGVIGGLVGTFVAAALADWVFPFVYNIGLNGMRGAILAWIFLGGLIAVEQMTLNQAGERSSIQSKELIAGGRT